jgi:hypothetical protein
MLFLSHSTQFRESLSQEKVNAFRIKSGHCSLTCFYFLHTLSCVMPVWDGMVPGKLKPDDETGAGIAECYLATQKGSDLLF